MLGCAGPVRAQEGGDGGKIYARGGGSAQCPHPPVLLGHLARRAWRDWD